MNVPTTSSPLPDFKPAEHRTNHFTNVLGVFQGGGVRGAALAGAYAEAHARGVRFSAVAGTSAGSIVAALIAAGAPPKYLHLLLYRLTLEAQKRIAKTRLAKREIIRRLGTSPTQLYRLLDQTNYRKSVDQMLRLLQVLDCDVQLVVREKSA